MRGKRLWIANKKARVLFRNLYGFNPYDKNQNNSRFFYYKMSQDEIDKDIGLLRKTSKPCSCWMCGNIRRAFGCVTLREAKQHDEADFQYNEFGIKIDKKRRY